ncbi:MAG TPA: TonB family protein, partial [Thermoanaerobaculia bacterium]|nr:TonB family protein [Thermoanaerobaculia bacterium]
NHNNIIHIYDLGKIQNSYYIAMEYIDGFDLKAILRRGQERDQPMSVELALFIASKLASALDYAHRKKDFEEKEMGLVHRDVSPQNVLVSQEGDIKLCDFGIAKAASKASHTQAGALKGKLQYMSPEQAWGRHIDRRSDIFALATVLFEMLTNRKLFTGDNELSILEQVREARVQPPSLYNDEVTPEVDKIVIKALQKDPTSRYQTAGEMARDIDAVLYSFRPTPTSADLAIYMHRLSSPDAVMEEPAPAPAPAPEGVPTLIAPLPVAAPLPAAKVAAAPIVAAAAAAPAVVAAHAPAEEFGAYGGVPEPIKRKSAAPLIGGIAAFVLVGAGVAYFVMNKSDAPAAPVATNTIAAASTTGAGAVPAAPAPLTTTTTTGTVATTTTAIDPNAVTAEVQRRMAAERARLEALARQQQAAATQTAAPVRPIPAPVQQPVQTAQAPAPAPVVEAPRPTPPPVTATQAPEPVAETRPAPAPAQPQRAREGDLVAAGTEGLTAPKLLRRGTVPYPPMARMQKVEGVVITSVLVSETGQVVEVRVLRGISRAVGLNEAAQQAMRRSTFQPAMKDGVRVRSWVTVPVDFKL